VNGNTTKPGSYPSAALLGWEESIDIRHPFTGALSKGKKVTYVCGGTLINRYLRVFYLHIVRCAVHFFFSRFLDFFLPNLPGTGTGKIIPGLGEFGR